MLNFLFLFSASLNGIAHLYQNLTYNKTQSSVFCTDRTMQYSVNLTDKFPTAPTFWFKWFIDGRHIETEENRNFFEFVHNRTGLCTLTVEVTMDSFGKHKTLKRSWLKPIYFEGDYIYIFLYLTWAECVLVIEDFLSKFLTYLKLSWFYTIIYIYIIIIMQHIQYQLSYMHAW